MFVEGNQIEEEEVPLAAYTDRLSGRPGDTIKFYASSSSSLSKNKRAQEVGDDDDDHDHDDKVTARLVRSICCDPNPDGPGVMEQDVSSKYFFPERQRDHGVVSFPVQHQPIHRGSYARTQRPLQYTPEADHSSLQIEVWVHPTSCFPYKQNQYIWKWGALKLLIDAQGCIHVSLLGPYGQQQSIITTSTPIVAKRWYHILFEINMSAEQCGLTITQENGDICFEKVVDRLDMPTGTLFLFMNPAIDDFFYLAYDGRFNGKLESPQIKVNDGDEIIASWDLASNMSGSVIHPESNNASRDNVPSLVLHNHPMRGIKGRLWDGTEFCWKHKPSHYAAVYFHDDDCYNFQWKSNFEWTIPSDMPSGVYIVRLHSTKYGHEEALPIFICPPLIPINDDVNKKKMKDKVCILIPTFTYVMYGNHKRDDYDEELMNTKVKAWNAYPYSPAKYPRYGLSTYNHHNSDGTGICMASHRRPLFNLRPQYLTFSQMTCSGLRHFPADTHLIAWMHHHDIDYDIVTDHELHKDGVAAIANYSTLETSTHPEYHTIQSLNAIQEFRDKFGGHIAYLGGNGFYWRIAAADEDANILEIRRSEGGVRTWASEPGEYYHTIDGVGSNGGLWRNNYRAPQKLVGIGFAAQGTFHSAMPYRRACFDSELNWVFEGVDNSASMLGDYGFSGNGAAGFELDRIDPRLEGANGNRIVILAQAKDTKKEFMFVPEDILTTYSNLTGMTEDEARRADMIYFRSESGSQIFSVGSITFCGSLPWNNFDNDISRILLNVIKKFIAAPE